MLARAWDKFWFAETPLTRLAALRMTIMSIVLMDLIAQKRILLTDAASVSAGVGVRHWTPIYLFDVLGVEPIGTRVAEWLLLLALISAAMALVGLWSRVSCFAAGALHIFITGMVYSFGKPHHDKIALTFCLMALPLAPVGARLSLDSLVRRFRRSRKGQSPSEVPLTSVFAALPIRLTMVTAVFGYWFAGMSKVLTSGVEWANGYTLMAIMMGKDNTMSAFLAQHVVVAQGMTIAVLLLQVGFPLVLCAPWTRWFILPGAVGFHLGTWVSMDTGPYMTLWLCLACFISLEKVPAWIKVRPWWRLPFAAIPAGLVLYVFSFYFSVWVMLLFTPLGLALLIYLLPQSRMAIVYDGSCKLCRGTLAVILSLDWADVIEAVDLNDWERVHARWPHLEREACIEDMHGISSVTRVGYDTYRLAAWRLPLIAPFAWVLSLPPVRAIGTRIYARVALQRERDACGLAARD